MFKKKWLLPLMLVLVLTLTACSTDDEVEDPDVNQDPAPVEDEATEDDTLEEDNALEDMQENETPAADLDTKDEYLDISVKPEDAFDIYMEKYPDSQVKEIQLDREDGKYIYEVEGFDSEREYEIKINPFNGDILKEDEEMDSMDDDDRLKVITRANVEKVQALVDDAIGDVGEGAKLEEWTIEEDDGIIELEVEIEREGLDDIEYKYNVETGELLEIDN